MVVSTKKEQRLIVEYNYIIQCNTFYGNLFANGHINCACHYKILLALRRKIRSIFCHVLFYSNVNVFYTGALYALLCF